MKINKGIIYGVCLIGGISTCSYIIKQEEKVLEENRVLMDDIDKLDYNLENLYDNIAKVNELQSLQAEKTDDLLGQATVSKSSLLEDDFKRCKFDVLGYWVETYKKDKLYYENEPETSVEESTINYYLESDGAIEEIQVGEEESESYTILEGAESIPSDENSNSSGDVTSSNESETEVEVVEEPDLEKTFLIVSVSKYYNSATTSNIKYEVFNGTESLGDTDTNIGLKNLKLDSGYSNSRIDLIELNGRYDMSQLTYQVSLRNGENTISLDGLKEVTFTEDKVSDDYIVEMIDNEPIVFIKKEPIIGANRIEIIENIIESVVEESSTSVEESASMEESGVNGSGNASREISRETREGLRGPGETKAVETSEETKAEVVRRPKVVKIKETDELFTLSYNFECWGPSEILKKINDSVVTIVDNQNIDVDVPLDCIDNIQCKFNDSKFNIDESNKFIEFDFAVNIQILRSKLNNYLTSNNQSEISSNTINTFKNGFDKRFSLKLHNDNINILLKLQK